MLILGKPIAEEIKQEVRAQVAKFKVPPRLAVFNTRNDLVTRTFVDIKRKTAEATGIELIEHTLGTFARTEELLRTILHSARDHDGIIVQLPLDQHFDNELVRQVIPLTHDVDVYGNTAFAQFRDGHFPIMPPVVGAIAAILHHQNVKSVGKKVVVVGQGPLVGLPAKIWAERMGGVVQVIKEDTKNPADVIRTAEILVLGAGKPGMITPDMLGEGVMILDAGTSEAEGQVKGDADPACEEQALWMTPVPGGIGPVAVAMIFKNLMTLKQKRLEHAAASSNIA